MMLSSLVLVFTWANVVLVLHKMAIREVVLGHLETLSTGYTGSNGQAAAKSS